MSKFTDICMQSLDNWPDKLYRYQRPEIEWLVNTLLDNTLYYSAPSTFNDPFDCRVVLDSTATLARKVLKLMGIIRSRQPTAPSDQQIAEMLRLLRENKIEEYAEKELWEAMDKIGVLCLAEENDNQLLWGHYAQGHTGICLEFEPVFGDHIFTQMHKVVYEDNVPIYNPFETDSHERMLEIILTKSKPWSYEKEWRVWLEAQGPGHHEFEPERLTGIIFGCRAKKPFIKSISGINDKRDHPVPLYQATEHQREFALDIVPL